MIVAVDWDGTLVVTTTQEWTTGAVDALRSIVHAGHEVIIHSCRANWPEGMASMEAKLASVGLNLPIWADRGKPAADVYLDDRGVYFDGNWAVIVGQLNRAAGVVKQAPSIRAKPPLRNRRSKPVGWH